MVGSGAGGGTLAARLAEEGRKVVLLEAGSDSRDCADAAAPGNERLPDDYDVPAFHCFASENAAMKWDFCVRHYADDARQRQDEKYREEWDGRRVDGVLYPRAATLGGCTTHNAMILMYPHNQDWDGIAELTGDRSWRAEAMHRYFVRLENCRHRRPYRLLAQLGLDPTRHGWSGWLSTERAIPKTAFFDFALMRFILGSALALPKASGTRFQRLRWFFESQADPNDWRLARGAATGLRYLPLATHGRRRVGARESVLDVAKRFPDRLRVELDALATRVLFDGDQRAVGVEYLKGRHLYRAHARPSADAGERREVRASREVILAGGAFNTPQLLMLSGIGPRAELEAPRHHRARRPRRRRAEPAGPLRGRRGAPDGLRALAGARGARFARSDRQYRRVGSRLGRRLLDERLGDGRRLAVAPERPLPDLVCFALLGDFHGYFPGYSRPVPEHLNYLTWAINKGHTRNRGGEVRLRSADPRDPPHVNFRYFDEGSDGAAEDLDSVVEGIRLVRALTARLKKRGWWRKRCCRARASSRRRAQEFVKRNAWGHHASCTCAIGPRRMAACWTATSGSMARAACGWWTRPSSPAFPGFFLVRAVYMIGEKAADVILAGE